MLLRVDSSGLNEVIKAKERAHGYGLDFLKEKYTKKVLVAASQTVK